jgi:hypothetical protein
MSDEEQTPIDNTERLNEIFKNVRILFQAVNGASKEMGIIPSHNYFDLRRGSTSISVLKKEEPVYATPLKIIFSGITMLSSETLEEIEAKKEEAMNAFVLAVVMSPQAIQKALEERKRCIHELTSEI